ncbi:MAG: Deoxyuridine 5'-triphosphate nucleotidohydrolase [Spirochaetes bacterium ADurb.Bin110]|jgi:dUTP pyrophosphatase|nr:MAG: Deoxyuridine 5'-triphosphate nucleotidohydrolase [Spirochaetes bacterium ADurb.Bin110]
MKAEERGTIGVLIALSEGAQIPQYATDHAAGADLYAVLEKPLVLQPLSRALIPTGLRIALPSGFEAQIRPRSGWAYRHGVTCLNSPGTIDSDYRGEIKVILINLSEKPFVIENGDRIAQLVIAPVVHANFSISSQLDDTARGADGFGSTGR